MYHLGISIIQSDSKSSLSLTCVKHNLCLSAENINKFILVYIFFLYNKAFRVKRIIHSVNNVLENEI